ncbi:MAG TPA: sigma-70 family RNA polymerase sigma factor [Acidimicrobiales bacterium]|nr:sigma-70 family RNA polymerase sigma factor [Acidimicrobiales bacterium]
MRQRARAVIEDSEARIDARLVEAAASGEVDAFEELYRRHVHAAWRVAQAVTGNADDATDAVGDAFIRVFQSVRVGRLDDNAHFRPYLMASARNAAVDVLRRAGRVSPTDSADQLDSASPAAAPAEVFLDSIDSSLVAAAFRSLPERWRSVLWLTEVEGITPTEAAPLLGVSPNGVAQLAVRARAGLRERFLQAHLRQAGVEEDCRHTVDRLGAYVAGGLAPREIAKVDQHLAGCQACRRRTKELEDLGSSLRRVVIPLPVALATAGGAKWQFAASSAEAAQAGVASASVPGASAGTALLAVHKPLAMATVALFAAGVVGAGVTGRLPGTGSSSSAPSAVRAAAGPASPPAAPAPPTSHAAATPPTEAAAPAAPAGAVDCAREALPVLPAEVADELSAVSDGTVPALPAPAGTERVPGTAASPAPLATPAPSEPVTAAVGADKLSRCTVAQAEAVAPGCKVADPVTVANSTAEKAASNVSALTAGELGAEQLLESAGETLPGLAAVTPSCPNLSTHP